MSGWWCQFYLGGGGGGGNGADAVICGPAQRSADNGDCSAETWLGETGSVSVRCNAASVRCELSALSCETVSYEV